MLVTVGWTLTGIVSLYNTTAAHSRLVQGIVNKLFAVCAHYSGHNLLDEITPSDKLIAVRDKIMEKGLKSDEDRFKEASEILEHDPTPLEFKYILQLILYKDGIVTNSVWLNKQLNTALSWYNDGVLPAYYITCMVNAQHVINYYMDFLGQVQFILCYLVGLIPITLFYVAGGVGISMLVIIGVSFLFKRDREDILTEISRSVSKVVSDTIPAVSTLFILAWNNRYYVTTLVSYLHWICAYFHPKYQLIAKETIVRNEMGWKAAQKAWKTQNETVAEINETLSNISKTVINEPFIINNANISPAAFSQAADILTQAFDPTKGVLASSLVEEFKKLVHAS